jgi:glycosyltransferase involved in cell wall biosynthesis
LLSQPAINQALTELGTRLAPSERRIFAVAQVRNESDIIERFVRHALSWADAILVVDHASSDGTGTILRHLRDEGLSVGLLNDNALGKHHADRQTQLARAVARIERAHVIVPLDADEFLVDEVRNNPRRALLSVPREAIRCATWKSYVPIPSDQSSELDVLKRITHRRRHEADPIPKVIIGVDVASQDSFRLSHGSHSVITAADLTSFAFPIGTLPSS